jgi:hypothetical protein
MNGTQDINTDEGYAAALSGQPLHPPHSSTWNKYYFDGNGTGTRDREAFEHTSKYAPLPTHTDDNYMRYYIGFANGAAAADKENRTYDAILLSQSYSVCLCVLF